MRIFFGIAAGWVVLAAASAQENPAWQKTAAVKADLDQMLRGAKVIGVEGAIMGPAVKGAPYSAEEIHETTQVLADGTRIHNETKTTISRDSQGRVRRESPGQIVIWDGTTGTSYMLNQSSQTGQKMQMNYTFRHLGPGDEAVDVPLRTMQHPAGADAGPLQQQHVIVLKDMQARADGKTELRAAVPKNAKKEALGNQILEGVTCDGTRLTSTIEAGAIGNDRPIQSTEERWYSPDLQVDLMVRKADPRTGEDVVRLTNVRRIEPDPSLFTVPAGYQIK